MMIMMMMVVIGDDGGDYFSQAENVISERRDTVARAMVEARCPIFFPS